jgi:uncharacterized protein YkwD
MPALPSGRRRAIAWNRSLTPFVVLVLIAFCNASSAVPLGVLHSATARAFRTSNAVRGITRLHGLEPRVLDAINDLRRAQGLKPLRPNPELAAAASRHSISMAEHGVFEHTSPDGLPFSKRIEASYPRNGSRIWSVGENLVWASPRLSAGEALRLWLASPPHRKNLLSPAWREIGLGAVHAFAGGVYGGRDVTILTVDFGVRR